MPAQKSADAFLTYTEIAAAIGISANTLRQWANRGKLPEPDLRIGQSPAWRRSTIAPWIRAYKTDTAAAE